MNNIYRLIWFASVVWIVVSPAPVPAENSHPQPNSFMNGVDANYSIGLAERGIRWKVAGKDGDLFRILRSSGINSFRVRVWTREDGPSGRNYACTVAKRAKEAGLNPYLVFFLSDDWSDYVKQPSPAAWHQLAFADKVAAVSRYCEETARSFRDTSVGVDLFEIGNEIDFGICGEFEPAWEKQFDFAHMEKNVWNRAAQVIRAAEQGIQRVNPRAKFILHLTQWWNPDFCTIFIETMRQHDVQVDFIGLSFFPSAGLSDETSFAALGQNVRKITEKTNRPVIICEYAYPRISKFAGQFASWNREVPGYPISESGQRKWITDFLAFCRANSAIRGAFYWSPEWYPEEMWKAFALFGEDANALEGLSGFKDSVPS